MWSRGWGVAHGGPSWLLLWLARHARERSPPACPPSLSLQSSLLHYTCICRRRNAHSHPPAFAGQRVWQLLGGLNMDAGGVFAE
jgi:hypothetical protein